MNELIPTYFQQEALQVLIQQKKQKKKSAIIQLASGLGKTYLAAFESINYEGKILFVCHRNETHDTAKKVI